MYTRIKTAELPGIGLIRLRESGWSWIRGVQLFSAMQEEAKLRIVRNKEQEKTSHEKIPGASF